jgi:type IV secretion system protein VirB5
MAMIKQLRKALWVLVLGLGSLGAAAPATAGMPVIDVANLAQAIQQVLSWGQQLQGMTQQYNELVQSYQQLQSTYNSLTGPRGMQNLVPVSLANRNYLPVNYSQMTGVINGTSTAYPALSSQVQTSIQTNAILSTQGVNGLSPQAQQFVRQSRQAAATLSMLSQQNQANASSTFSNVQTLISALGSTADTKASADLNGRIQSEQVMTQTNQIKTDALYQSVQAQQLQNAQLAREAAVRQQGAQTTLTPIAW